MAGGRELRTGGGPVRIVPEAALRTERGRRMVVARGRHKASAAGDNPEEEEVPRTAAEEGQESRTGREGAVGNSRLVAVEGIGLAAGSIGLVAVVVVDNSHHLVAVEVLASTNVSLVSFSSSYVEQAKRYSRPYGG